jgi:hypothetical protein
MAEEERNVWTRLLEQMDRRGSVRGPHRIDEFDDLNDDSETEVDTSVSERFDDCEGDAGLQPGLLPCIRVRKKPR